MADIDWDALRAATQARIGLGRCGHAQPTRAHLDFQEAHARARDAIWMPWQYELLRDSLENAGWDTLVGHSTVDERRAYLLSPGAGRALAAETAARLEVWRARHGAPSVVVLVSDGLSAHALHAQGHALTHKLLEALRTEWQMLGPVVLVPYGRVALSDAVGDALGAAIVLNIIGERPGLSAVDSVAIYLTYAPRAGNTDAHRNCISNIREPHGLSHAEGVRKAMFLAREATRLGYGGYRLKDASDVAALAEAKVTVADASVSLTQE